MHSMAGAIRVMLPSVTSLLVAEGRIHNPHNRIVIEDSEFVRLVASHLHLPPNHAHHPPCTPPNHAHHPPSAPESCLLSSICPNHAHHPPSARIMLTTNPLILFTHRAIHRMRWTPLRASIVIHDAPTHIHCHTHHDHYIRGVSIEASHLYRRSYHMPPTCPGLYAPLRALAHMPPTYPGPYAPLRALACRCRTCTGDGCAGGAMRVDRVNVTVVRSSFSYNEASVGGALHIGG